MKYFIKYIKMPCDSCILVNYLPIVGRPFYKASMHPSLHTLSFCALTALAAACAPVHAAGSKGYAAIENFKYELVDLNLNDGISPYLTVTNERWGSRSSIDGQRQGINTVGTTWVESAIASAGGTLSASTISSRTTVDYPLDETFYSSTDNQHHAEFTLSPNTRVIFTGVGTIEHEIAGAFLASSSAVSMEARVSNPSGVDQDFRQARDVRAGSFRIDLYGSVSSGNQEARGSFVVQTMSGFYRPIISPVPEPSTYGMMLAGTFLIGAVARRRRHATGAAA